MIEVDTLCLSLVFTGMYIHLSMHLSTHMHTYMNMYMYDNNDLKYERKDAS